MTWLTQLAQLGLAETVPTLALFQAIQQQKASPSTSFPPTSLSAERPFFSVSPRQWIVVHLILSRPSSQVANVSSGKGFVSPPYKSTVTTIRNPDLRSPEAEKRHKMRELAKATFPDGIVPDPYVQRVRQPSVRLCDDHDHIRRPVEATNVWYFVGYRRTNFHDCGRHS
jgi:hypothetical protein